MRTRVPNPHNPKKLKPRAFSQFLLTPLMSLFVKFLRVGSSSCLFRNLTTTASTLCCSLENKTNV